MGENTTLHFKVVPLDLFLSRVGTRCNAIVLNLRNAPAFDCNRVPCKKFHLEKHSECKSDEHNVFSGLLKLRQVV